ncbi:MAG: hypothetical protein LW595_04240 [Rickettsiales bacterium]|nr:hypothetical protein [Rickettsiales bacterium]
MTIKILNKNNNKKLLVLFFAIIAILNFFTSSLIAGNSSDENEYGVNRIRSCANGEIGNEFSKSLFNKEFFIDLSNASCAVKAAVGYTAVKASIYNAAKQCGVEYNFSITPQPWSDVRAMIFCNAKLLSGNGYCKASIGTMDFIITSFFTEMLITKKIAQENYWCRS